MLGRVDKMKVKPCWQLKFKLKGVKNLIEDIDLLLPSGNKLILKRSDSESDIVEGCVIFETNKPNLSSAYTERKKIIDDEIKKILGIVVLESQTNLKLEINGKPEILNKDEFPRIHRDIYVGFLNVIQPPIEGNLMAEYLKDAVRLKQRIEKQNESDIHRIINWFRMGMDKSEEERFIMLWISFNALYGYYAKKNNKERDGDVKQIDNLLNNFPSKRNNMLGDLVNRHTDKIDELSNANLISLYGKNRSADLKNALKAQNNREILKKTALCIYAVRNDLFHGGNVTSLINPCTRILQDLIKVITKEIIL